MPQQHEELSHAFLSGEWECIASVHGWLPAMDVVKRIANEQCDGNTPMSGGSYHSNRNIIYRFRCPFWNSHGCRWECRFVIKHSDCMYCPEKDLTKRAFHHRAHAVHIVMLPAKKHVNHMSLAAQGPGLLLHGYHLCAQTRDAIRWKKKRIVMWLHNNDFPDAHQRLLARIQGN